MNKGGRLIFFHAAATSGNRGSAVTGFAGIAFDLDSGRPAEEFSLRVPLDGAGAAEARSAIAAFMVQHGTIRKQSRKGGKGAVRHLARLAGYGVAKYDYPHLRGFYEAHQELLPADPFVIDLAQVEAFLDPKWAATTAYDDMVPKVAAGNLLEQCTQDIERARNLWTHTAAMSAFG